MNIIIPMGGVGARFEKTGYRFPKPMVNIVGRPMLFWLLDHLCFAPNDTIWIALSSHVDAEFSISSRIKKDYPKLDLRIINLSFNTRGAAETLFVVLNHMNQEDLGKKTISLDCDTFYFADILQSFRNTEESYSATFYFKDLEEQPVFSYVKLDEASNVIDIREKVLISNNANTGAYAFSSAELLRSYCARLLDDAVGAFGEYYISSVIKMILQDGNPMKGIQLNGKDFVCVGTPRQLQTFISSLRARTAFPAKLQKMRFCFDLDNTLVTFPTKEGDYTTCLPKHKNIRLVQDLSANGHYIIIWTSRRMKTHNGNVGAVLKDVGRLTLNQLADFNIPYDEIQFGKPQADLYVDDLAVNALVDTEKEIGWCVPDEENHNNPVHVRPRHFNNIVYMEDVVVKSSSAACFNGELYFYEHMPTDIEDLLPKVIRIDKEAMLHSVTIEKIKGVTFSHLLTNRCVTDGRLLKLLYCLDRFHQSAGHPSDTASVNIYANYADKLSQRFDSEIDKYCSVASMAEAVQLKDQIVEYLKDFEKLNRGIPAKVVHGDPVFSNVLLTSNSSIYFIDMRGMLGSTVTLQGDIMYDLAKVYQSLCGYDYILLQKEITEPVKKYLSSLRTTFMEYVKSNYPSIKLRDLEVICASLYFSLLPLHNNNQAEFYKNAQNLMDGLF